MLIYSRQDKLTPDHIAIAKALAHILDPGMGAVIRDSKTKKMFNVYRKGWSVFRVDRR